MPLGSSSAAPVISPGPKTFRTFRIKRPRLPGSTFAGAAEIIAAEGLAQTVDIAAIEQAAREVMEKSPENVAKFKSGNEGVFKFFVGQVMKATKGQANPQVVNDVVRKILSA